MKYKKWPETCYIKDVFTGKIIRIDNKVQFCKENGWHLSGLCNLLYGILKIYKGFCLPSHNPIMIKVKIKNLINNKIYSFKNMSACNRYLHISNYLIKRLCNEESYRYKHFAHVNFNDYDSIPTIKNKLNGSVKRIYTTRDAMEYDEIKTMNKARYFLYRNRIPVKNKIELVGCKNYKFKIIEHKTNKIYKVLSLKEFAADKNIDYSYLLNRSNNEYSIIEG